MTISGYMLTVLFLATALAGLGTTWFSILLSHRLGILDRPDPRKAHREPVAYLGGLGILLAFLVGVFLLVLALPALGIMQSATIQIVLGGAVLIFLVGFWDDVRPVPAIGKLLLQISVASAMWFAGVRVEMISYGFDAALNVGAIISYGITVGWYVGLMNALNLVDGLDGLAGGISLIGAVALVGVSMVILPSPEVVLGAYLAIITAGSVLGFLAFNWHPAKTFMGDGGSLLLGFLLATASLVSSTKTPTLLALSIPLVALGLPIFETAFSFIRRAVQRQHPFKPDRRHLHHRLLDLGLDQRRVVLFLLFITAFLGINSVILAAAESRVLFLNVVFMILGLILLIENLHFLERRRNGRAVPATVAPPDPAPSRDPVKEKQLL